MGFSQQVRAGVGFVALLCASILCAGAAVTRPARSSAWDEAVARRAAFDAEQAHTRAGFQRLQQMFRAIFYDNPADPHAAEAVDQVAMLLAEQGRELNDPASSRAAIKQYEFLRAQYPGSPLRAPALLAEARIDADALHDPAAARVRYQLLLHEAPRSASGRVARAELAAMDNVDTSDTRGTKFHVPGKPDRATERSTATPAPVERVTRPNVPGTEDNDGTAADPVASAPALGTYSSDGVHGSGGAYGRGGDAGALVTGIRHWSTSTYTRVAIDLGGEVTFEAARVSHPDRLYFDLHGARLAPELVGKSFAVTDNGFLRQVRAAQEPGRVTRVVLDVSDVTEYSAFLLPNPERLIIDVHGGNLSSKRGQETASVTPVHDELAELPVAPAAGRRASAAANRSGLPPTAPTDGGEAVRPLPTHDPATSAMAERTRTPPAASLAPAPRTGSAVKPTVSRPVPNAVAVRAPESTSELAAVSTQPGRVEATRQPTTRPVAATVKSLPLEPASDPASLTPPANPSRRGKKASAPDVPAAASPTRAAERTADGQTSLVRALGLRIGRIVIDAGHGGHDSGTLGVDGIQEKDVVLDVALRLGKLLHERLGAEIIYTRSDDTFIPLETRTAIANRAQADLFLSIHANSSPDPTARGVETYYLNFTSDPTALDVAARENAAGGQSVHQLSDLVKKIALKDKIAESREFATDVEGSLYAGLQKGNDGLKNRGVKKAPFVVLIGANMPSILAEISFVTNARDAEQLREPEYRERVAESLFAGVAKYENGLAGGKATPGLRASTK